MKVLAIDPGLRACGVALGDRSTKVLLDCGLVKSAEKVARGSAAHVAMARAVRDWARAHGGISAVVCETPMQYQPGHHGGKRVDPDDILQLQGVVGALSALFSDHGTTVETIYPYVWKGQLPKEVCFTRVKSRLTDSEYALLQHARCAESLRHNVADAVGIFLHSVGRFRQ